MKLFFTTLIIVCFIWQADAQVGRLLKERAKSALLDANLRQKAKDKLSDQMDEMRAEYDSSSFNYAIALSDNAGLFESKERFERQQKFMMEYFQKKNTKITPIDEARGYVDRAEIMYANGKYRLASLLLIQAIIIYDAEQATNTIDFARTLANSALVAHSAGRLTLSKELTEKSLELREQLLGKQSKGYAASLNNYALLKMDLGLYNEAEKLMEESIALNGQQLGNESMGYAITLNNKASLYQVLGRYDDAEPLFKKAIDIAEVHLREKSGNFQQLQTNLALLYQDMGRYEEAEKLYLEAIKIKEKKMGITHPDYAHLLNTLASLYVEMGKDEEVEDLLKRSIKIYSAKMGENSKNTAAVKSDLGNFYVYKGRSEEALPILQQVIAVRRNVLGASHPTTIKSTEDLAIVHWKLGNMVRAKELYTNVMHASLSEIDTYFLPMSESEKANYWKKMRPRFQRFYAFAAEASQEDPQLLIDVFNLQLATKALILNSGNKIRNTIMQGTDEQLKTKYRDWLDQKESLSTYYTYSKAELEDEKINVDSLEAAANASEKYLSENSSVFSSGINLTDIKFEDIKANLSDDEVLLEIIHTSKFDTRLTDDAIYIGLAVDRNSDYPRMAIIENGTQLETRYYSYYNNVIKRKMADEYSYDQYWAKFDKLVTGKSRLFLSVDGVYNQININTLKGPSGDYLVNLYTITQLSNSRDIIHYKSALSNITKKDIFLLGYPSYGGDGSIVPLPGTKKEIDNISGILKAKNYRTTVVSASNATEEAVKAVSKTHIIHIATHGFFLEDLKTKEGKVFGINTEKAMDNPLLRSGLMFTGAGNTVSGQQSPDLVGNNNGILTAFETMNLSLDESNLVVLSACETGLGDVQAGEGVYGLQRALLIAGADNLIMSLWKVDDTATQKLMTYFYRNLGTTGNIAESFRKAQNLLRKEYSHPYYWGAFVLVSG